MTYELPQNINYNKIFIVNHSELEGRLEPVFYLPEIRETHKKLNFNGCVLLGHIAEPIKNGSTPNGGIFEKEGINYYRSQDFDMYDIRENQYISNEFNQTIIRSYVKKNDILLAVVGATLGKVGFISNENQEGNINQNIARIRISNKNFSPEFIAIYLNSLIGQMFINRFATITTQAYLNNELIAKLPIPTLSYAKQLSIISLFNKAYFTKQSKETESQKLLNSIDDYLLSELGITLPENSQPDLKDIPKWMNSENPLVKNGRLFLTNYKDIINKRWDAFEIINGDKKVEGGKYPNKKLKQIAHLIKGQSITSDKIISGDFPVIAGGQTSPYNHNQYNFKGNIITISASGAYSGFVWYHNYPIFASDCTVVYSKNEDEIFTVYLSEVLRLKQKEIYNLQQGAGQPHVYSRDLSELNIPIPPMEKQKNIVSYISEIRNTAKQLLLESDKLFEDVKAEIESIILGD